MKAMAAIKPNSFVLVFFSNINTAESKIKRVTVLIRR